MEPGAKQTPKHTCLPQNCIFRNPNHQNPEHGLIFQTTLANIFWFFKGKSQGNPTMCILNWVGKAENAVRWSRLTVHQSNHFTTILQTSDFTQMSPFLSSVMNGHFSWYSFLNVQKCLFFTGNTLADAISRLSHAFPLTQIIFENDTLILFGFTIVDTLLSSGKGEISSASCLPCMCRSLLRTNPNFSVFHPCAT